MTRHDPKARTANPKPDRAPITFDFAAAAPLEPPASFVPAAAELGIEFDKGDVEKLGRYLATLLKANEQLNLTAITDPTEAWTRHILDSLTLLPLLADLPDNAKVIDVGTGGGLPGLPLAIVMPHLSFTLLEATGKKVEFLRAVAAALALKNITVIQSRAEQLGQDRGDRSKGGAAVPAPRTGGHRESYDAVTARAVGRLATLAELTIPFAKPDNGLILLIKGQKADEELAEAEQALHQLKAVHAATVNTPTGRILVLEKRSATPKMYPRRDGEPARTPIGVKRSA
jgi:16S rRNA (guanine527-N7)-methyltransferase